jgi:hypothetical protein
MSHTDVAPAPRRDLMLEIDVAAGDDALLRVVSTLHHRHARVRSLTFEGLVNPSRLRVTVAEGATREFTLERVLRRCIDVLDVRLVPTSESAVA